MNGGAPAWPGNETVAYDAATGNQLYVISSPDAMVPWRSLAVSPDGATLYVATVGQPSCGFQVTAYAASDGTPRWTAVYPDCGSPDGLMGLALSPDGSTLYAATYGSQRFATVAWDASTGAQLWATVNTDMRADGDILPSVAASPDGSKVFVLGFLKCASRCSDQPLVNAAYDASSGTELWESRYDSGGTNYPADLAVSADSSLVFTTGQEQMPCYAPCTATQVNAPLIAYDTESGAEAWVDDYQDNVGFALAASPNGSNVYIGGTFTTLQSANGSSHVSARAQSTTSCSASACGYSVTAYNAHAGPGVSQDRDPSPHYDGWSAFFDRTALGGAYRASRIKGQTATFTTPVTRKVAWVTHIGRQEGRAGVLIDGHPKGTFDLYAAAGATRSFLFTGLTHARHVVTIKVLGTKDAASRGRWVAIDAFNVKRNIHQESALGVRYDTWTGVSSRAASGGSYRVSGFPRARLTLAFTGSRVNWVTATGPAYGRARVVIDGRAHTVDLYRARQRWRVKISYTSLGPGTHHITVIPLGTRDRASASANVAFDAFVVR